MHAGHMQTLSCGTADCQKHPVEIHQRLFRRHVRHSARHELAEARGHTAAHCTTQVADNGLEEIAQLTPKAYSRRSPYNLTLVSTPKRRLMLHLR